MKTRFFDALIASKGKVELVWKKKEKEPSLLGVEMRLPQQVHEAIESKKFREKLPPHRNFECYRLPGERTLLKIWLEKANDAEELRGLLEEARSAHANR